MSTDLDHQISSFQDVSFSVAVVFLWPISFSFRIKLPFDTINRSIYFIRHMNPKVFKQLLRGFNSPKRDFIYV